MMQNHVHSYLCSMFCIPLDGYEMSMVIPKHIIERIEALNIEEVAEKLGIHVVKHNALCFMHQDHTPSISFSTSKNMYRCWVCDQGGGCIQLVQDKLGCDFKQACIWLADQFNIWWPNTNIVKKSPAKCIKKVQLPKMSVFDEEIFTWLINNTNLTDEAWHFLFNERHFKEDVVSQLKIRSISNSKILLDALVGCFGEERCLKSGLIKKESYGLYLCFYTPCLLFPYYEQDGRLVGIQSRYLGNKDNAPRFQFLSSQKTRLFNLPLLNGLKQGDKLYISEGITDCIALLSAGHNAVAIPSATIMPLEDLVLLKRFSLYMYPDQDASGQRAFMQLKHFYINLYSHIKAVALPVNVKDYCEFYHKTYRTEENE